MPKPTTETVDAEIASVGGGQVTFYKYGRPIDLRASRDVERAAAPFLYRLARLTIAVTSPTTRATVVGVCEVPTEGTL